MISNRLAGQLAAALWGLGGLLMVATSALPGVPGAQPLGVALVGLSALGIGGVVWRLPWERWPRTRTGWFVPPAFLLVALDNAYGANEPFRYGLFFIVIFLWLGLVHPRPASLLAIPCFVAAYLLPLAMARQLTVVALTSAGFVLAIGLLVGGTVGWVTHALGRAQAGLREREERFRLLLQHASDLTAVLDAQGGVRDVCASIERTMGYQPATLRGTTVFDRVHPEDTERLAAALVACQRAGANAPVAVRYRRADGAWRQLEVVLTNQLAHPALGGIVLNARDVTERAAAEAQLAWQARHDVLTGLENRAEFARRVAEALRHQGPEERVAVLFIDLDGFKAVNDATGHDAGDQLLVAVAARLRAALRPADILARQGGDEFTVLLTGLGTAAEGHRIAERLVQAFASPFTVGEDVVAIGTSVGIALSDGQDKEVAGLLRQADLALYAAKRQGKGRVVAFVPGMRVDRYAPAATAMAEPDPPSAGARTPRQRRSDAGPVARRRELPAT